MRIVLADDHKLFLDGLHHLLVDMFPEADVVTCSSIDALRDALRPRANLASVDLRMPGMNGVRTLNALMRDFPEVPFVVISGSESVVDIEGCRNSGVLGYIRKSDGAETLESALRKVVSGETCFPDTHRLAEEIRHELYREVSELSLSDRQYQVLRGMADNLSNKGIAEQLYISENTVKTHIKHLFAIFDATNRLDCVQKARMQGLL